MDPAVTFLLETLKDEILSTSKNHGGVRNQISTLRDDLSYCQSVLESWTKNPIEEDEQKALVKQLREAVYEAEDILADFVAEETKFKNKSFLRKLARRSSDHTPRLSSVAEKIQSIKHKAEDMRSRKNYKKEDDQGMGSFGITKPKMVPTVEEEHVVGFDGQARTVIEHLTTGPDDLEVITIVGMAGLGKTTLAKMIYRDSRIEFEFYNRVWVYVSRDCDVREVFLQILSSFTRVTSEMREISIDKLAEEVRRNLEREKYLIVMDDVWEPKDWNALQKAFPKNKKNSRILITSRNEKVAKYANPNRLPYKLNFLTLEESLDLLNLKALGSRKCPPDLMISAKHIADQCRGLPLSIVVIGGILRERGIELERWRDVSKDVEGYINVMDPENNMEKLIALSFYQLPYSLKACFLYFGMFPQDHQISARRLIRMWIAEGFIRQVEGINLERIAEEYLEDLVNRNLVIVGKLRSNGKIKTCHVHSMIRGFCIKLAAEENLYQEVKQFDPYSFPNSNPDFQNYRRICVHSRVLNYLTSKDIISPHIRSFSCSSPEEINLQSIPKAFKSLRVLDGNPITFSYFPHDLAQLVHLKYLVLSIKDKILPEVISDLWNLQTLIVYTSSRTLEIKGDTWKTLRLRHLETNASMSWKALAKATKMKEEVVRNENLTTLSTISPETCTEDAFKRVPNINKLGIRGQLAKFLNGKDKWCSFDNLLKLESLQNLKLINDGLDASNLEREIVRLPDRFPPHMKRLTLTNTQLDWSDMSLLGRLEYLEILKLKENAFKGVLWKSKAGEFPSLKVLDIGRTDLVYLEASDCQFQSLQRLSLQHCTYLRDFQTGLANMSSLHTVELFWTTASAVASIKKLHNEKAKQGKGFKLSIYPPDHDK